MAKKKTGDIHYPLHWPEGRPRRPASKRKDSRFTYTMGAACEDLMTEIGRMGGRYVTISSNVRGYKKQGVWRPYASEPRVLDPAVAVYFDLKGDQICMAGDLYTLPEDNVRAISKTIEAMRGIERWGCSDLKAAFTGFRHALPAAPDDWQSVLGVSGDAPLPEIKKKYRQLAAAAHPDRGGNQHEMIRLNSAFDAAKKAKDGLK